MQWNTLHVDQILCDKLIQIWFIRQCSVKVNEGFYSYWINDCCAIVFKFSVAYPKEGKKKSLLVNLVWGRGFLNPFIFGLLFVF